MKPLIHKGNGAFTLVETLMAIGVGSLMLAAVLTAGVALQRSLNAVETYSISENDQLRVQDYIAMDCRRALTASVTSTVLNGVTENQLTLTVPIFYNPCSNNSIVRPTLTSGTLSYALGSGTSCTGVTNTSVTIKYYQNGSFFDREVISQNSDGSTSDVVTHIARNVATFTVTPQDITTSVRCSIFFFPTFKRMAGNGTWRNGPSVPSNSTGVDGDYYVIDTTGSNATTWGNVYNRAGGVYSLLNNVKATMVYCNTFLRNAGARQ